MKGKRIEDEEKEDNPVQSAANELDLGHASWRPGDTHSDKNTITSMEKPITDTHTHTRTHTHTHTASGSGDVDREDERRQKESLRVCDDYAVCSPKYMTQYNSRSMIYIIYIWATWSLSYIIKGEARPKDSSGGGADDGVAHTTRNSGMLLDAPKHGTQVQMVVKMVSLLLP